METHCHTYSKHKHSKLLSGFTALIAAAYFGHTESVEILLKKPGIDTNIRDNYSIFRKGK